MGPYTLYRELWVPHPLSAVFDFFSRAENLEQLTPPWMHLRILTRPPIVMKPGASIAYNLRVRGVPLRWLTEIECWNPPHEFVDVQAKGPYKLWRHTHRFSEVEGGTSVVDTVRYALPFGTLGRLVHRLCVVRDLDLIFDYRAQRIQELLSSATPRNSQHSKGMS
jgi:ligand-binding SRPBCC domain-containing protein